MEKHPWTCNEEEYKEIDRAREQRMNEQREWMRMAMRSSRE